MAEYQCSEDFINDILIEIPNIDRRLCKMLIQRAFTKFCRDTLILKQTISATISENNLTYQCIPTYEGFNITIDNVARGTEGEDLVPYELDNQFIISADRNSIVLGQSSATADDGKYMEIDTTIIPFQTTDTIDANLLELYSPQIIMLSKHMVYNMGGKAWSDRGYAQELLFEYNNMLTTIAVDGVTGNTSGEIGMELDFF